MACPVAAVELLDYCNADVEQKVSIVPVSPKKRRFQIEVDISHSVLVHERIAIAIVAVSSADHTPQQPTRVESGHL